MAKDPLSALNEKAASKEEAMQKEIESLKQTVSRMSNEQEALREANRTKKAAAHYSPDSELTRKVWEIAYSNAIKAIYSKGLSFWNSKTQVLKSEMQLAIIRADEAVEAFIVIRRTFMDPVLKEQERFDRENSTNPLVKVDDELN